MTEGTFLQRMLAHKRLEVERQQRKIPLTKLRAELDHVLAPRPFAARLRHASRLGLIAEIKKQSPAKGLLAADFDPLHLARVYAASGADAISVLTDNRFFGGSLQHLKAIRLTQARDGTATPLLRKDFVVDPYQVYEARVYGADAVLIIVGAVPPALVRDLIGAAAEAGLEALVEVHTEQELAIAVEAGAVMIGINNRDLHTFEVDVGTTERLLRAAPELDRPLMVSLSGIRGPEDLQYLRGLGADAILVGEALMTAPDPAVKVRELSGMGASRAE